MQTQKPWMGRAMRVRISPLAQVWGKHEAKEKTKAKASKQRKRSHDKKAQLPKMREIF